MVNTSSSMSNVSALLEAASSSAAPTASQLPPYQYPEFGDIWPEWWLQISVYSLILFLSVLGNVLVFVTLIQNTKMRTVTNVYLLNLSIADLLCGVFCMPFTLVGSILKNFIFGNVMCKIIPFLQGRFKCREQWPSPWLEKCYMIFIDLTYLVIPIVAMFVTFVSITRTPAPPTAERSLASKRRVIKMLFVVVLEFFVCWTPVYVINTVSLYDFRYCSACCNPITYCFMNSGFRQSFLAAFGCRKTPSRHDPNRATTHVALRIHIVSGNAAGLGPAGGAHLVGARI
ncbi:Cholecystokinin receptor type A [Amphibalanus amphitrite]|uniref:Cholecystokinin receptor type A n=1 Tax=Amphibalanus amphitrite TaxID=1232801 RepID=A0A6A4WAI7_AMPAM|nr:Cholecystokinin receptor type A [Amphibalanus amphitrite]